MGLFSKKTNEEKIIEDMKKKKEQVDKLKEEINKMGKLVLKDGKLTKVDDTTKTEIKVPVMESPPMPQTQGYDNIDVDEMVQAERLRRQQAPVTQQPAPQVRQQVSPPPMSQEEYQYKLQQDMLAYQRMQQQAQIQARAEQEAEEREMLRQQALQQQYRPPVQEVPAIGVTIEMITGNIIKVNVPGDKIESFIEALNTAIDNQSSFPITSKVINGRNVVSFTIE